MSARYWHRLPAVSVTGSATGQGGERIECDLCPRHCRPRDGQRGYCFVRRNIAGQMVLTTDGRSSGFQIDPIEKKPLNHVAPGSAVLSFGTAGCNLGCQFCQNWRLSTARDTDILAVEASPDAIAQAAVANGCTGVAYTYNDPVIFAEYAIDVAQACRQVGLRDIAVTAGYIEPAARADLFAVMDAANVDLKGFNPDFYRQVVGGRLDVVQNTLEYLVHHTAVWVEITTLVIPGYNDSDAELTSLADWIVAALGADIPWHVSAFHPDHRLRQVPPTPAATLTRARQIGQRAGLHYVYTGNRRDPAGATTTCPDCGAALIVRDGFTVTGYDLTEAGTCRHCGHPIPGRWADSPLGVRPPTPASHRQRAAPDR